MTYALLLAFFRNDMGFGGNNGLTDFKDILGFNVQADDDARRRCSRPARVMLALAVFVTWAIVAFQIRQAADRRCATPKAARASSAGAAENVKLFAFTVSAVMAGIAGALYVPQVGIINPGEFEPANSIEVVIWTAVGGRGTIVGPIVGARARQRRQSPGSPARCRNSGCLRWAGCSSPSRCSCPRASSACGTGSATPARMRAASSAEEAEHRSRRAAGRRSSARQREAWRLDAAVAVPNRSRRSDGP